MLQDLTLLRQTKFHEKLKKWYLLKWEKSREERFTRFVPDIQVAERSSASYKNIEVVSMDYYAAPIARLIEEFSKLPGIGRKTAQRLAFHVLNMRKDDAEFINAILEAIEKQDTVRCANITDIDPCFIAGIRAGKERHLCGRKPARWWRWKEQKNCRSLHVCTERYRLWKDRSGRTSDQRTAAAYCRRMSARSDSATNPTIEGEATAMYLSKLIKPLGSKRPGLPMGFRWEEI